MTAQKPRFMVSSPATIKHLNVRKEGPEDEKALAVDVKVEFEKLGREICYYFDDGLAQFLWNFESEMLPVRNTQLAPIQYLYDIENAVVKIDRNVFLGCDVKKFAISARDGGMIDMTCSIALYPTSTDVADLAKLVQDGAFVTIDGPPDLFDVEAPK